MNGEEDINFGSVYENAVAQEMSAHGFGELTYSIGGGVKATGTGAPVTLTDEEPPADKAFYRVEVSAL